MLYKLFHSIRVDYFIVYVDKACLQLEITKRQVEGSMKGPGRIGESKGHELVLEHSGIEQKGCFMPILSSDRNLEVTIVGIQGGEVLNLAERFYALIHTW